MRIDPMSEIMTAQIPDGDGKLWVPAKDKTIRLRGPISARAFIIAHRMAKSVEVVPA
jgi:hypothetical protein